MNVQPEDQTLLNENLDTLNINTGTTVKIKEIQDFHRELESEDYYYLKDFQNKTGTVVEMEENHSGTFSYKVTFNETLFGYFYRDDFTIVQK